MNSHAQIPSVLVLPDRLRVYFSSRPVRQTSITTFVDLDRDEPSRILALHEKPILELGRSGAFDEHGIMPQCVLEWRGKVHLYYTGWSQRVSIPYSNWTGLALSGDGGRTFVKYSDAPILDRGPGEIFSALTSSMLVRDGVLHAWYVAGTAWIPVGEQLESVYDIRHATSEDGIVWRRDAVPIFPARYENEAITRPTVVQIGDTWHMWFCCRSCHDYRDGSGGYRIGYAWSKDLQTWNRDDESAGITTSKSGWDSLMLAYPYVVRVGREVIMFYNGNGFGRTGFGYAVLES